MYSSVFASPQASMTAVAGMVPRRVAELLCRSEYEVYLCQKEELTDFFT